MRDAPDLPSVPPDERQVLSAWERFLVDHELPGKLIRRVVQESWRRCQSHRVDPHLRQAELQADTDRLEWLRQRHAGLCSAAHPILRQARELLSHSDTLVLLTNPDGLILDAEGDARTLERARSINLVIGGVWDESISGTNAIGTALAIRQPVQLYGAEHFCAGIKRWTCSADVIRDPHDGQLLGVIDVSGLMDTFHSHSLAFVVAAARQIEANLSESYFRSRSAVLEACVDLFGRCGGEALLALDSQGRLVKSNEHAAAALRELAADVPLSPQTRIAGLDLGLPERERLAALPPWLRREWLQPILRGPKGVGTLIVLPRVGRPGRQPTRSSSAAEVPKRRGFARILGQSPALQETVERAQRLARAPVPLLLLGETGVGKEVFARAIHEEGPTAVGPFVAINCGALSRELLPSELFGYVEGAFTGARRGGMPGKFEAAEGGTLFLDEIGEMPIDLQPQLLRVLQEREVVRLGESRPRKVNVRVLAATNRDLREEVSKGHFRQDLYYRLSVASLRLPPLRERAEDLELLIEHLQAQLARDYDCRPRPLEPELLGTLQRYRWPGNVRELRNVLEGMLWVASGDRLTLADLPAEIAEAVAAGAGTALMVDGSPAPLPGEHRPPLPDCHLATLEREAIVAAISGQHGNLTRAARKLGIARSTLYKKMEQYGIARTRALWPFL